MKRENNVFREIFSVDIYSDANVVDKSMCVSVRCETKNMNTVKHARKHMFIDSVAKMPNECRRKNHFIATKAVCIRCHRCHCPRRFRRHRCHSRRVDEQCVRKSVVK